MKLSTDLQWSKITIELKVHYLIFHLHPRFKTWHHLFPVHPQPILWSSASLQSSKKLAIGPRIKIEKNPHLIKNLKFTCATLTSPAYINSKIAVKCWKGTSLRMMIGCFAGFCSSKFLKYGLQAQRIILWAFVQSCQITKKSIAVNHTKPKALISQKYVKRTLRTAN